jgi:aerobic carbon-monoxide dehydrogenase medium subunit
MHDFAYHRPSDLAAATSLLREAADPKLLAGGMTLLPALKNRLAAPSDLIDLAGIPELFGIRRDQAHLRIGAMTCHFDVSSSDEVRRTIPALALLAGSIGDPAVRHRGTLGGSAAAADPAADYPAALVGLEASIETTERTIPADEFFLGLFETALRPAEIVTGVRFAIPDGAGYTKVRHPASGYPVAGVMVARFGKRVRVAVTGAGPTVFRFGAVEAALMRHFSPASATPFVVPPEQLLGDLHCSAEYRSHLIQVLVRQAVENFQR